MGPASAKTVITLREAMWETSFGAHMAKLREQANLTQREAGERTGLTNAYICQVENNQRQIPRPLLLVRFAKAYGVSPTDLLDRAGYLQFVPPRREHRLWRREREDVLRDPAMAAEVEDLKRREAVAWDQFRQEMERLESWGQDRDRQFREDVGRLAAEEVQAFRRAIEDPVSMVGQRLKEGADQIDWELRALISRLHRWYRFEREWREALEKRYVGEVTDAYGCMESAQQTADPPVTETRRQMTRSRRRKKPR